MERPPPPAIATMFPSDAVGRHVGSADEPDPAPLTGTPLAGLHHRERWRAYGRALVVREATGRCRVAPSTAFRWPGCTYSPGVQHEAVNRAAGQRLRGSHPIQTVNQRHWQLQQFLLPFHGVATKCLGNCLRWHQEIGLASQPSPWACLLAFLAPQCTLLTNL